MTQTEKALDWLAGLGVPRSRAADAMMDAIARQESGLTHRVQLGGGPARGLWQFEMGGGVRGVLHHHATRDAAVRACVQANVVATPEVVWRALASNDWLAAVFARLLLWSDPAPLPPPILACEEEAWRYYQRTWRPGKPHRRRWTDCWRAAISA